MKSAELMQVNSWLAGWFKTSCLNRWWKGDCDPLPEFATLRNGTKQNRRKLQIRTE